MSSLKSARRNKPALTLLVCLGCVSLLSDAAHEGARSVSGPFLESLGATATIVGVVSGIGELIGYGLRILTGYIADKTRQYWLITYIGYFINFLIVPMLGLAGHWPLAALLLIIERFGKAIRTPARDAILSNASKDVGRGFGFGVHEALDQVGAMLGPLIVAAVLYLNGEYKHGFFLLAIPAALALVVLFLTSRFYPHPCELETNQPPSASAKHKKFPKLFWIYLAGIACIACGYADYPLIAYHFEKEGIVSHAMIPVFYATAMGVDAVAAFFAGKYFDRLGLIVFIVVAAISLFFAPLVFLTENFYMCFFGAMLWGLGMGAQESIMRAWVAQSIPIERRATAYGVFNGIYGIMWCLGSILMGFLYDHSLVALTFFSMAAQALSIPFLIRVYQTHDHAISQ